MGRRIYYYQCHGNEAGLIDQAKRSLTVKVFIPYLLDFDYGMDYLKRGSLSNTGRSFAESNRFSHQVGRMDRQLREKHMHLPFIFIFIDK